MSYTNYTDKEIASLGYVIHKTKVDFVLRPVSSNIDLIQDDQNMSIIKIELLERSKPFEITQSDSYEFKMGKIDRTFVWIDIFGVNQEEHSIYVKVVNQMCTVPGKMLATVRLSRDIDSDSPEYSNQETYDIGTIVRYQNNSYECIEAVTTPEEFDTSKWKRIIYSAQSSLIQINIQKNPISEHDAESQSDLGIITELVIRAESAALKAEEALNEIDEKLEEIDWFDKTITNEEIDALFI